MDLIFGGIVLPPTVFHRPGQSAGVVLSQHSAALIPQEETGPICFSTIMEFPSLG